MQRPREPGEGQCRHLLVTLGRSSVHLAQPCRSFSTPSASSAAKRSDGMRRVIITYQTGSNFLWSYAFQPSQKKRKERSAFSSA
ncbi:hypothetical protein AOLI_G00007380 [Acnodon oligacanthus]